MSLTVRREADLAERMDAIACLDDLKRGAEAIHSHLIAAQHEMNANRRALRELSDRCLQTYERVDLQRIALATLIERARNLKRRFVERNEKATRRR